jgi:hypothetical protein
MFTRCDGRVVLVDGIAQGNAIQLILEDSIVEWESAIRR